jgi:hypothetical protein
MLLAKVKNGRPTWMSQFGDVKSSGFFAVLALHVRKIV